MYAPALFAPLLATVEGLYSDNTRIVLGYETRHTSDADFFRQMDALFERTAVPPEHYHKADGVAARPDISVYQLTPLRKRGTAAGKSSSSSSSTNTTSSSPSYDRMVMWFAKTR